MEIVPRRKNLSFLLQQVQQTEAPVCEGSVRLAEGERAMPGRQAGRPSELPPLLYPSNGRRKPGGREAGGGEARSFVRSSLRDRIVSVGKRQLRRRSLRGCRSVGSLLAWMPTAAGRNEGTEEGGDLGWAQTRASLAATSLLRSAAADADGAAHTSNADLNERKSLVDRPRGR